MRRIRLLPLGPFPSDLGERVAKALGDAFGVVTEGGDPADLPPWAWVARRRQYDSTELLRFLERHAQDDTHVLGLTEADLGVHILTFVFGEARLGGPSAVVSTHRLRQEFYGLPADDGLLAERLAKEAVHEAAHTLGLTHCRNAACVMFPSDTVEDTDVKALAFCRACAARLPRR